VAAGVTCEGLAREYVATVATPSKRVGYTLHAELTSGTLPDLVTILPAVNGEVYVTRLGANLLNVSLVGTHDFIQVNRNPEFLASMLQAALTIRYQLSSGGYGSGHFQARRCSRHPDLYLLGDAAESFDPACGLGMTHALHSGIMTAEAVIKSLHLPDSISVSVLPGPAEWQSYARQIRRYSAVVRLMMRLVHVAPRLCGAINPKATAKLLHMFERLLLPAVSV
jgi:flavin-dependent dehydrogenase